MSEPTTAEMMAELRRIVQRIALVSHAPTQSYNVVLPGDDVPPTPQRWRTSDVRGPTPHLGTHSAKGGDTAIPRGSVDRFGDRQPEYRQKSHVYFERRLTRLLTDKRSTQADLAGLLDEARQALTDWMRTPQVAGVEVVRGSFLWKCQIADDDRDLKTIQRTYTVSKATVYRYRLRYRGLRKTVPTAA